MGASWPRRTLRVNEAMDQDTRAVLIAGPTASGKSSLALTLAAACGGIIINTDSMQVYRDLHVISARPSAKDTARVLHRLYGDVDAAENYSVGRFLSDAQSALADAVRRRRLPIFVGGTGLYFKALTRGLAAVPPIDAQIRKSVRERLAYEGPAALHAELARRDPTSAAVLKPTDRVRIARALEVIVATGRPLAEWREQGEAALIDPMRAVRVFLAPDRAELYRRIDSRFDAMLARGALDEVRRLDARNLDPLLPAMKAHGVPWLRRHLAGEITLAEAAEKAKQDTRHYAKRQFTWFRHQLGDWPKLEPERALEHLAQVLRV
jgi:tRNA dimethylallyltransferase